MRHYGVRYETAAGRIVASVVASTDAEASALCGAGEAFLSAADGHDAMTHEGRWVVVAGALVALPEVTLTPDVLTFAADGIAECTITASGTTGDVAVFVMPGGPVTLPAADAVLVLTADVATIFRVTVTDPALWAEPLTVRAV